MSDIERINQNFRNAFSSMKGRKINRLGLRFYLRKNHKRKWWQFWKPKLVLYYGVAPPSHITCRCVVDKTARK